MSKTGQVRPARVVGRCADSSRWPCPAQELRAAFAPRGHRGAGSSLRPLKSPGPLGLACVLNPRHSVRVCSEAWHSASLGAERPAQATAADMVHLLVSLSRKALPQVSTATLVFALLQELAPGPVVGLGPQALKLGPEPGLGFWPGVVWARSLAFYRAANTPGQPRGSAGVLGKTPFSV